MSRSRCPASRPSRSTVMRSQMVEASSSRCVTNMIATPSLRSLSMMESSRCTSDSVSAEVGSSMMIRRLSSDSARAISTSCCSATDSAETGVRGSMVEANAADDLARGVDHLPPVHQAERSDRRAADEDVFGHRQRRDQAEFLVDGDDARPLGLLRARRLEFHAVEDDAAARRRLHARQNLEQGGLAGAVLAKQAEDLAAPDLERDIVQRRDAGEMLGHALDGEKHLVSRCCCGLR